MKAGAVIGGSSGENAVVVIGKALGLHKPLLSAGGTANEIGECGFLSVIRANDLFCGNGHFVRGTRTPIPPLLSVAHENIAVFHRGRRSTHIGVGHRVATAYPGRQVLVPNRARVAAVACSLILAVPAGSGHPDFNSDIGIAGRHERGRNTAERREIVHRGRTGNRDRSSRFKEGRGDFATCQWQPGKIFAGCGRDTRAKRQAQEGKKYEAFHRFLTH